MTDGDHDPNRCFICGDQRQNSLEQHHIVPQRFDGSDDDENLVTLCASCHAAIEKLYDRRFYDKLGVKKPRGPDTCELDDCTASAAKRLNDHGESLWVCSEHGENCGANLGVYSGLCSQTPANVVRSYYNNEIKLRCDDHSVCGYNTCKSNHVFFDPQSTLPYQRCSEHFDSSDREEEKRRK